MRPGTWTWLAVGFVLALSACDDEILTDVDLPKDATVADRAADAPKEGATSDSPPATDSRADEPTETIDGGADTSDSAANAEGGDATDASNDTAPADAATTD